MTLQGHLAKAWAHLQQARDLATAHSLQPTPLTRWIGEAIATTESATREARVTRAEQEAAVSAAIGEGR